MNSAVFLSGTTNMIAKSVEQCRCPERYTGLSCQNPAEGYYRWHNITETSTDYSVEEIIGRAVPCQCNGRSSTCNPETGFCLVSDYLTEIQIPILYLILILIKFFIYDFSLFIEFCRIVLITPVDVTVSSVLRVSMEIL